MSYRAPDPHNLRGLASTSYAPPATVVVEDRPCGRCGYNLRGLPSDAKCPECGTLSIPPRRRARLSDDPLSLMPQSVIAAFIRGCWLASACVIGVVALMIAAAISNVNQRAIGMGFLAISIAWVFAAYWLTPATPVREGRARGFTAQSKLRLAARWMQLAWPLTMGLSLAATAAGRAAGAAGGTGPAAAPLVSEETLAWMAVISRLIATAGIVVLSIMLSRLAEWARDEDAERRFNWVIFGLPVAVILSLFQFSFIFVTVPIAMLWLWTVLMFPYGLLSLSKSVTLSIIHAREHRDRQQRMLQRARDEDLGLGIRG